MVLQLLQGDIVVDGFPLNKDLVSMGQIESVISICMTRLSRVHAYVQFTDEGYVIYDFNSRNGFMSMKKNNGGCPDFRRQDKAWRDCAVIRGEIKMPAWKV